MKHDDILGEVLWNIAILSALGLWILLELTK
jgi:hypothetical protein